MKKIFFLFVAAIAISSCSKDDDGNIFKASMSALIDDEEWNSVTRLTILEEGKFIITGTSLNGKILTVTIGGTTEGIYELSLSSAMAGAVYKESASMSTADAYVSATGEVNLTDVNNSKKRISGTFSFIAIRNLTNTINITEGEFKDLLYTETGN
jgi:hypothetical protein